MATAEAIALFVESALTLLRASLPPLVNPARIVAVRPDQFADFADPTTPAVTIFLYRVTVEDSERNRLRRTLPGGRSTRPLLPLSLQMLVTPWARQIADEHQILGRILQTFYDNAEMGPAVLQGAAWDPQDSVQLMPDPLQIEEIHRVWESSELPYRLSVAYLARVVGIEPAEILTPSIVTSAAFVGAES